MAREETSFSTVFCKRPMAKGLAWSLLLHLLFLVALVLFTRESGKEFMPITVLLAGDLPGQVGGNGESLSSPPSSLRPGRLKTGREKKNAASPRPSILEAPASGQEEPFVFSNRIQKAPVVYPDVGAGTTGSPSLEGGFAGGESTGSGQAQRGEGQTSGDGSTGGRVSTGSGRGDGSGPGQDNGMGGNGSASYLSANFSYIRDRILKALSYPAQARRMGWKGRVTISFIISDSGCVEDIKVVESSGHGILDAQAVKTIKRCQPFPRPPIKAEVIIPIVFRIG